MKRRSPAALALALVASSPRADPCEVLVKTMVLVRLTRLRSSALATAVARAYPTGRRPFAVAGNSGGSMS